ncbi:MAG: flagellar M-ring protein FliF, partial [Lachnospiraceae bacterium]
IPGTDSNNETTYQFQDGTDTESSSSQTLIDYLPNELISVENLPPGIINYEDSSLSLTAITYNTIKEEDAKNQGLLDGISWDEYKAANDGYTKLEVDPDFYSVVANATGIPEDSITILAYQVPQFIDKEGMKVNTTDILSVALIVIILALLAFVVIKSMAVKKEVSEEEELSVENLLQSTPEPDVEDIEVETKSETRKMIEKFVDENPEAAANLLRNWLNEDWA